MGKIVKAIDTIHNTLTLDREKYRDRSIKNWRQRMNDLKLYVNDPFDLNV